MKIIQEGSAARFSGDEADPQLIFDCGQAFRFSMVRQDVWSGIAHGKKITVSKTDDGFILSPSSQEEVDIWREYFDADFSYSTLSFPDELTAQAKSRCVGLRILKQEKFETIISFIISANNNIARIKKIIEVLCVKCGGKVNDGFAFPTPEQLASLAEADLTTIGAGYRAPYILKTSKMIADGFDLGSDTDDYDVLGERLKLLPGVGPKVADCILLFSYGKKNAFPVDVWIKRVLKDDYGFEYKNSAQTAKFIEENFGQYAGVAQQYLFHAARTNRV